MIIDVYCKHRTHNNSYRLDAASDKAYITGLQTFLLNMSLRDQDKTENVPLRIWVYMSCLVCKKGQHVSATRHL